MFTVNLLHVVQCYNPPVLGGAEIYVRELSEHLTLRNHKVSVFTSDLASIKPRRQIRSGSQNIGGVSVHYFKTTHLPPLRFLNILNKTFDHRFQSVRNISLPLRLFSNPQMPYLASKIGFGDWDLVNATSFPWSSAVLAYYGAKMGNIPFIVMPLFHVGHPEYECHSFFELLRKSDAIIALTRYESEYLATKSIPKEKIHVIGAGVNPNDFIAADGERFKAKYGLSDSRLILFMGNRTSSKGIFTLIESMRYVKRSYPNSQLILAGRSGREYDQYYSNLPPELKSSIVDVDVLSKQEKSDAFAAADIFVMPSKYESIGLVYLEAWMCSTPVIGSYSKTLSNVINDGEDGFLVDFGDSVMLGKKIVYLLKNDALREEMGRAGKKKVLKNYTWNGITSKIEVLYKSVINNY